jgi:DNA (cytosine-5)-methyltransferase 1
MAAYYNEIEPYAAEWLRNLIKAGHIPHGEVDTRSIVDVAPDDLRAFTQCHFFAGIGGWGLALRLAGWPDDRPIWTGSCPCQPFSVAGKGAGTDDPRHLWPHFHRLISAVRPLVVMGEQVAGAAGYGWLDGVRADLEREGYASWGADLPALAVNAPHIRQRLYWIALDMADASNQRRKRDAGKLGEPQPLYEREEPIAGGSSQETFDSRSRNPSHMADASIIRRKERQWQDGQQDARGGLQSRVDPAGTDKGHMADADQGGRGRRPHDGDGERDGQAGERYEDHGVAAGGGEDCGDVADTDSPAVRDGWGKLPAAQGEETGRSDNRSGCAGSFWDDHIWLTGSDGKARRSKSGLPLLAHGIPNRVGRLRAYGNAIVPPLAAEVIKAFLEATEAA